MWLALAGCGAELSNGVFYEDAAFLAALPDRGHLAVGYPGDPTCSEIDEEAADLYRLTVCSLEGTDTLLAAVTAATDVVREVAPTQRDTDYRRWGPGGWDLAPGAYLLGEMSRSGTGAYYTWTFSLSESEEGPWEELLAGHHYGGAEDIGAGIGAFAWDVDQHYRFSDEPGEGRVEVDYDLTGEGEVLVVAEELAVGHGEAPASADWWYAAGEEGDGDFEYRSADTLIAGTEVAVRARFTAEGAGRADATVEGGAEVVFSQCWDAAGLATWTWSAEGEDGDAASCAFAEEAIVEHLP